MSRRYLINSDYDYFKVWLIRLQGILWQRYFSFGAMLKHPWKEETITLRWGIHSLSVLLGSVKKQKRKRNSHRGCHGLLPLHFQDVDMVLFITPSKKFLKEYILSWPLSQIALTTPDSYLPPHKCVNALSLVHLIVTSDQLSAWNTEIILLWWTCT